MKVKSFTYFETLLNYHGQLVGVRICGPFGQAARVCRDGGFVRHGRVAGQLSVTRSLGDHHLKAAAKAGVGKT